jgi:hypothetical protein
MADLTPEGLVIRRQPEVLDSLEKSYQELINPDISVRDDEGFGQQTNIIALAFSNLEEAIEAVNNSQNLLKAEGTALDDIGSTKLIPRQAASKSFTSTQWFTESNGFNIQADTKLQNPITLDKFVTTAEINISTTNCVRVEYSITSVLDSTLYQVNVGATGYTYTSDGSATDLEIITGLKASIDGTSPTAFAATLDTDNVYLVITSTDNTPFLTSVEAYMLSQDVTTIGYVESEADGAINAPSNSVTKMVTSLSVVTTNPIAYTLGRAKESDEAYRLRIQTTQSSAGKATVEAIQDDTSLVVGVTIAKVVDNDLSTVDASGRPPHSFETIVQGGADADIGKAVLTAKPAGIESHGNTAVVTEDKYGNEKTVYITRPTSINLAFLVEYTKHTETDFPVGGDDLIKQAVKDYTDTLVLGQDITPLSYFGVIIDAVGALESLVVSVQQITNQGDPPVGGSWQTTKLSIDETEFGSTTLVDITTTEV